MSIASLLARAKQETGMAPAPIADPWPQGARVVVEIIGSEIRGRVAFADGDWIHWCEDGAPHASHATPSRFVRRLS